MSFGERLKEARILSGMRQLDAAKAMGMSRPTLSAIEADKRPLRASEVHEFAALYHVSTASLMEDEDPELLTVTHSSDAEIDPSEVDLELAEELQLLEPCGKDNEVPVFVIRNAEVSGWRFLKDDDKMARFSLVTSDGRTIDSVIFRNAAAAYEAVTSGKVDIFCNIEQIELAINKKRVVSFCYFDLDEKRCRVYRKDGQRYYADPIALVYSEDNYYLVTYNRKYDANTNYRVDRIEDIRIEDEHLCGQAQIRKGRASVYMKQVFKMYNGRTVCVTLEFDRSVLGAVYDKFGEKLPVKVICDDWLTTTVTVQVSPPFFGWVYQFGDKMRIAAPEGLEKRFKETENE